MCFLLVVIQFMRAWRCKSMLAMRNRVFGMPLISPTENWKKSFSVSDLRPLRVSSVPLDDLFLYVYPYQNMIYSIDIHSIFPETLFALSVVIWVCCLEVWLQSKRFWIWSTDVVSRKRVCYSWCSILVHLKWC